MQTVCWPNAGQKGALQLRALSKPVSAEKESKTSNAQVMLRIASAAHQVAPNYAPRYVLEDLVV